jgi:hypothetical protein
MKIQFLVLISLVMSAQSAWALDLKGIELGKVATPAQLKAAFEVDCPALNGYCDHLTKIADVFVHVTVSTDRTGRVSSIRGRFDPNFFAQLEKAARTKYGTPTGSETTPMQNGFGAQFNDRQIWWIDDAGARVWLVQYINATEGLLLVESASVRAAAKAKEDADKVKSRM